MRLDIRKLLVISIMAVVGAAATPLTRNAKLTTLDAGGDLDRQVRRVVATPDTPHWMGWVVPAVEGSGDSCCYENLDFNRNRGCCRGCKLEGKNSTFVGTHSEDKSHSGEPIKLEGSRAISVLLRASAGRINRVQAFSQDCELDAGGLGFTWLENVAQSESLRLLEKLALDPDAVDDDGDRLGESAVMAIAMHADPQADPILARLAGPGHDEDMREQAIFWMGNARGRAGYETLRRIVKDDPDEDIRDKAVFALSQSSVPEAIDLIINVAHTDRSSDVRSQALFWLSQEAGERAAASITEAVEKDPETDVKKKAVFALSQLPPEQGLPLLMKLASTHKNLAVRKEAIFWLGQSEDPRALDFIEEILTR